MDNPETPATLGTQDSGRKRTKQRNHNATQKPRKDEQHRPHQHPRVDQCVREEETVSASYKKPVVLLIHV